MFKAKSMRKRGELFAEDGTIKEFVKEEKEKKGKEEKKK